MTFDVISFTKNGIELADKIRKAYAQSEHICNVYTRYEAAKDTPDYYQGTIQEFAKSAFSKKHGLLFISSTGIAVRAIAECVEDKLSDSPVLVMDEKATYVISLLSGHMGGANEWCVEIASIVDAEPVITTATDQNDVFSVDLFAKEHGLTFKNRDGIKRVSTKAIEGKPVRLSIESYPPTEADVVISEDGTIQGKTLLSLCPKNYAVGMGCKKGKSFEEIEALFLKTLSLLDISVNQVGALCSIDIKEEEAGLLELSSKYKLPFLTFSAELLGKVQGDFSSSEFVASQVGVDNVCERAALAAVGYQGKLIQKKTAENGVTIAVAKR